MLGNAAEWVWDSYLEDYYLFSPYENPINLYTQGIRSRRGGAFGQFEGGDLALRDSTPPEFSANNWGFRCAVSDEP